jgi:hypothetical protein
MLLPFNMVTDWLTILNRKRVFEYAAARPVLDGLHH